MPYSKCHKPGGIAARPRQALDEAGADRIDDPTNTIGTVRVACSNGPTVGAASGQDDVRRERDQFRRVFAKVVGIAAAQRVSIRTLRPIDPAQFLQPLQERRDAGLRFRIVRSRVHQHADAPHPLGLLRARRQRPRRRRAAEQRDELAAPIIRSPRRRGRAGWRDVEPERLGRSEVDCQFILGRPLHGQFGRFLALENAVHIRG